LKKGLNVKELKKEEPRIAELPFDSERKLMTTVHDLNNGTYLVASKGAPDKLLEKCTAFYHEGEILPLNEKKKEKILQVNHDLATHALRVLAGAFKTLPEKPGSDQLDRLEEELVFAGLVGMIDP